MIKHHFIWCFYHHMWYFLHYMWCFKHFMQWFKHYTRWFEHYVQCFKHYMRCFEHYVRCFKHYMHCLKHYIWCFEYHLRYHNIECESTLIFIFRKLMFWLVDLYNVSFFYMTTTHGRAVIPKSRYYKERNVQSKKRQAIRRWFVSIRHGRCHSDMDAPVVCVSPYSYH